MLKDTIVHANRNVVLKSAPIERTWIIEGEPVARNAILSSSGDSTACTLMWDCTAGTFDWHYDFDETVHIVEGSVIVSSRNSAPKRLEPGDVAFFPVGTQARWHVEAYVRKVAFCRRAMPREVLLAVRGLRWAKALFRGPAAPARSLMEA